MIETGVVALCLGERHFVARLSETEQISIERGDRSGWDDLRPALKAQRRLMVRVPEAATFPLALARQPRSRRELRAMLRETAPVVPGELAWTWPRPLDLGGAVLIIVRRPWLDERIAEIERELPTSLHLVVDPTGDALIYRSPAARRRNSISAATVAAALFIAVAALLVSRPQPDLPVLAAPPVADAAALPRSASVAATLLGLGFPKSPEGPAVAIHSDRFGMTTIEVDVADPDLLRLRLEQEGALTRFREIRQVRIPDAGYRVTYRSALAPASAPGGVAPPLAVSSREEAIAQVTRRLTSAATVQAIVLRLTPTPGSAAGALEFAFDLTGPQPAVLGIIDEIESGRPPARVLDWRVVPDVAGVRLSGTLQVPWSAPR